MVFISQQQRKSQSTRSRRWARSMWTGILVVTASLVSLFLYTTAVEDADLVVLEMRLKQQQQEQQPMVVVEQPIDSNIHDIENDVVTNNNNNLVGQAEAEPVSPPVSPPISVPIASPVSVPITPPTSQKTSETAQEDAQCPFKDSSIYRKVYVYPSPGQVEQGWTGDMLSEHADEVTRWPFLDLEASSRANGTGHFNIQSQNVQYSTELLVRQLMIHPDSCLRTYNPEEATLFYVPYLPSVEHHKGSDRDLDYSTSPYGQAIMDILDREDYAGWEKHFGLTSKYWKRREGADHILVFSEPMHGLYHPRSRRGNFHFIHSQKQLKSPIVISVELSTTFVEQYPQCAAKNILVPYPNTDGNWFNGKYARDAAALRAQSTPSTTAALPVDAEHRPVAQFYRAGNHGTCTNLRKAMKKDYESCAPSFSALRRDFNAWDYKMGMQLSTFCPCPGGDSPSAKRHYDALFAGCIPIILSHDFVWPFSTEILPDTIQGAASRLRASDFALRLSAPDYEEPLLDSVTCQPLPDARQAGLQAYLESLAADEIARLREGAVQAAQLYAWYPFDNDSMLVANPLRQDVLPTGGAAHEVVRQLGERQAGALWPACRDEVKIDRGQDARKFVC